MLEELLCRLEATSPLENLLTSDRTVYFTQPISLELRHEMGIRWLHEHAGKLPAVFKAFIVWMS